MGGFFGGFGVGFADEFAVALPEFEVNGVGVVARVGGGDRASEFPGEHFRFPMSIVEECFELVA